MSVSPVLIGCSHGTDSVAGRAAIRSILDDVHSLRPDLDVREAFVDVQTPEVADVVAEALAERGWEGLGSGSDGAHPGGEGGWRGSDGGGVGSEESPRGSDAGPVGAVVVPLLLSTGFHVKADIADSVAGRPAVAAPPMGPHPLLVDILVDRLAAVALTPADAVVLASAGSTDPDAAVHVREVASGLAAALGRDVTVAFGAGAHPRVPAAVASAREALPSGGRVVVASYLLAPGYFHDRVLEAGADVVTAPLAPDPRLAQIALERYAEA